MFPLLAFLLCTTPLISSLSPAGDSPATLDPKQLKALEYLNIGTGKDPCNHPTTTTCDDSTPVRHLISLRLTNCSSKLSLSSPTLDSLSTLRDLQLLNCLVSLPHFPPRLASSLISLSCISSPRRLTGVSLSRLRNLHNLTLSGVRISASGPTIFLGKMNKLTFLSVSQSNLSGYLPKKWSSNPNLTHFDLSINKLKGRIPISITSLQHLQFLDLSSNSLTGELPSSFGDLLTLKNLSLSSNSLSGPIPDSLSSMQSLIHLDLSSNQFNGTIPRFLSEMRRLKYLNLEKNNFQGIIPFNGSFIKSLASFKVGDNSNLCYNHSIVSSKLNLGIARCDKNGFPVSPPADDGGDDGGSGNYSDSGEDGGVVAEEKSNHGHHGVNKVALGVGIAIASIVFLIVFLICISRKCC